MTTAPRHEDHDQLLIAAHAAGDLTGPAAAQAAALLAACPDCRALAADLALIARATSELPAPARSRDFSLSPEQAARLRPRGWRRFADALGRATSRPSRPLAVALTTLGLAGLLVASLPSFQLGGTATILSTVGDSIGSGSQSGAAPSAARAPGDTSAGGSGAPVPAGQPSAGAGATPAPTSDLQGDGAEFGPVKASPGATAVPAYNGFSGDQRVQPGKGVGSGGLSSEPDRRLNTSLAVASGVLLALGLAMFVLRRRAGRDEG